MRVEIKVFAYLVPFFVVAAGIYAYFTRWDEWVGIVGLALTAMLCLFIAGYLALTARKLDDRPEDNPMGEIEEQAGDYGFFSPHSWWPLWVALASAFVFLGVAIGWWLAIIAAPFAAIATVGWTFEYFQGNDAI